MTQKRRQQVKHQYMNRRSATLKSQTYLSRDQRRRKRDARAR